MRIAQFPEVGVEDARVALHLRRGALGDLAAAVEHDHGVAEAHHERHVVLDDEEREPFGVQAADVALDRLDQHRVDAGGRLVEQHEARAGPSASLRTRAACAGRRRARRRACPRGRSRLKSASSSSPRARSAGRDASGRIATMLCGAASTRFSSTVRFGKTRACWNVRIRPRRASRVGSGRRTTRPSKRISPRSAGR